MPVTDVLCFHALSRYANLVQELQRVDMSALPAEERLPFFLNLHNAMAIHAVIRVGQPGAVDRRPFFSDFQYVVGGQPYSLAVIRNGILRANRRQPYTLAKPFGSNDRRLEVRLLAGSSTVLGSAVSRRATSDLGEIFKSCSWRRGEPTRWCTSRFATRRGRARSCSSTRRRAWSRSSGTRPGSSSSTAA
jgi:hypothetical protein